MSQNDPSVPAPEPRLLNPDTHFKTLDLKDDDEDKEFLERLRGCNGA